MVEAHQDAPMFTLRRTREAHSKTKERTLRRKMKHTAKKKTCAQISVHAIQILIVEERLIYGIYHFLKQ